MTFVWKYIAMAVAALALIAIGFSFGHSSGYKSGFDAQQVTINDLTNKINADRQAALNKITVLEQASANQAAKIDSLQTSSVQSKTQIVTKYQTEYIKGSTECGLDNQTVKAINSLITVDSAAFDTYVASIVDTGDSK